MFLASDAESLVSISGLFIVKPKDKETLSSPSRFGFLTEPDP